MRARFPPTIILVFALLAALAGAARTLATDRDDADWPMIGQDPANSRNQPFEHLIRPANVHRLALKWFATTRGDVSGTPAVVDGAVYFGDFGGMLWKLDAETGAVIWSHHVSDYTGIAGDIARTSPSLAGNTLVVGDLKHPDMIGIDARTGDMRWLTQVHPDPKGIMTGSPVLAGDTIFTGVSASGASGPGATFRGAIVALDLRLHRDRERHLPHEPVARRQHARRRRPARAGPDGDRREDRRPALDHAGAPASRGDHHRLAGARRGQDLRRHLVT